MANRSSRDMVWVFALAGELRPRPARRRTPPTRAGGERNHSLASAVAELRTHSELPGLKVDLRVEPAHVVQGIFDRADALVHVMSFLAERVHPSMMIYGLGFGSLGLGRTQPSSLEGTALENSRAALWTARREQRHCVALGFGEPEDPVLSYQFELMHALRTRWTPKQAATVRAARRSMGKDVAADFGVSPSVVSESLKLASYRTILGAERACVALLEQFGCQAEGLPGDVQLPAITDPVRPEIIKTGSN